MKKSVSLILVLLLLLGCFTSCDLTTKISDQAKATPEVEKMITALAENDTAKAKDLMHPQVADSLDDNIARMSEYLDGRDAESIEVTQIHINTSTGTAGKVREEQATYQVTLTDGDVISLEVVYLSNNEGEGFYSFGIVI